MFYQKIHLATVTVHDYRNLVHAWRQHGTSTTVSSFVCKAPLTPSQLKRLPKRLRERMKVGV
jgi:hypothetical protein